MDHPEGTPPHAGVATWFIDDKWSHPHWDQYVAILMHLRPVEGMPPPTMYGEYGYEWHLWAIHPDHRLPETFDGFSQEHGIHTLEPLNYAYQFNAEHDAAAMERVEKCLEAAPSLDTDWTEWFNHIWEDTYEAHSLRR